MVDATPALVVAAHGRHGVLETGDGERQPCFVRHRKLRICCGDHVLWMPEPGGKAIITAIMPRENELLRQPQRRGPPEVIAANITHLVAMIAPRPGCDPFLVDRYLCAGMLIGCQTAVAWNKDDLGSPLPPEVAVWRSAGHETFRIVARHGNGIGALLDWIGHGHAIVVGQSGVGKSSLLNALVGTAAQATGSLSAASDEGRHTTTASVMHRLPNGGRLTDTPGVREFIPAIGDSRHIADGFAEIRALAGDCRYADCLHIREPQCAVKAAAGNGDIDARRYESYRRLIAAARGD